MLANKHYLSRSYLKRKRLNNQQCCLTASIHVQLSVVQQEKRVFYLCIWFPVDVIREQYYMQTYILHKQRSAVLTASKHDQLSNAQCQTLI